MNMVFLAKSYRRSDDHDMDFLAKVTDDPTITGMVLFTDDPTITRTVSDGTIHR